MLDLVIQSSAPAIGIFVGTMVGLMFRSPKKGDQGLLGGSKALTAVAAGGVALLVMMGINLMWGAA